MTNEETAFRKRLEDLARQCVRRQYPCFSDFLGLNEQNIYHSTKKHLSFCGQVLFGGYEGAERQMLVFLPDAFSFAENTLSGGTLEELTQLFPISAVRITPRDHRFAETLTHRDILGAVLNLGIDRDKTGDILPDEEGAWLFCEEKIASFISDELFRVRHTEVEAAVSTVDQLHLTVRSESITASVASARIDALIAAAFHGSRSSMAHLPASGKVFCTGRLIEDPGFHPGEGDIISVRGCGRFKYLGIEGSSRKGRLIARLEKYI